MGATSGDETRDAPADPSELAGRDGSDDGHSHGRRGWRRRRGHRAGPLRIAVRLVAVVVVIGLGYYLMCLWQVWSTGRSDQTRPVDAIVVMGAAQYDGQPSPQLAARLDHVLELWPQGVAPLVIVTGGQAPGDRFTEAETEADYLIERGIPADAIDAEDAGRTTYQSMQGVAQILADRGLDSVLIVTDPYHALRARLIAQHLGLTAYASPTTTGVVRGGSNAVRHLEEAVGVAVGRLIGFDHL